MRTNNCGTYIAIFFTFIVMIIGCTATSSAASSDSYILNVTIDDEHLRFADHNDSEVDGNWIVVDGGDNFRLPSPMTFTYNGVNTKEFTVNGKQVNITLNSTEYSVRYPFDEHPMFTNTSGKNNVNLSFYGSPDFADENVDLYLLKVTKDDLEDIYNGAKKADTESCRDMLENAYNKSLNNTLNSTGDIKWPTFNGLEAGDYVALVLLNSTGGPQSQNLSILSATAFEVLEYDSLVTAPIGVKAGDNVNVGIELIDAPDSTSYTYGAVLIHEDVYRADMMLKCNGTKKGMNFTVNGEYILDGFDLVDMNISDLNANDLQAKITSLIGPNNGTVVIKTVDTNQTSLSLTTVDMNIGNYFLLVGVYRSGDCLAAFDQKDIIISSGESTSNIETIETMSQDVIENIPVQCQFLENGYIECIEFDPKISGSIVTICIETLKDQSSMVSYTPGDMVYKNINIWFSESEFENDDNIDGATIGFKVKKSWISQNNINPYRITLNRYHENTWTQLQTQMTGEDQDYIYFTAETPGFSCYSITGQHKSGGSGEPSEDFYEFVPTVHPLLTVGVLGTIIALYMRRKLK